MQDVSAARPTAKYRPPATGFRWAGPALERAMNRATIRSPFLRAIRKHNARP